jgi:triosephosphate isomerase
VDGALVGGASLEVESFMQLVEAAQETVPSEQ